MIPIDTGILIILGSILIIILIIVTAIQWLNALEDLGDGRYKTKFNGKKAFWRDLIPMIPVIKRLIKAYKDIKT